MEEEKKESTREDCCEKSACGCEKYKKFLPKIIAIVLLAVALGGFAYYKLVWSKQNLTQAQAKARVENFINENLMQGGAKANITSVSKENGMFKVVLEIGEGEQKQEITSYLSIDGLKFMPDGSPRGMMDIAETEKQMAERKEIEAKPTAEVPKTDKPTVELFVMSYCPYGTQIVKGILPVLDTLGAKIDYKMKFVSYAMHEKLEIDENLKQYCIQKNEPKKLSAYLKCFLKDDKQAAACLKTALVNSATLNSCIAATDKQFKITESYNDKASWSNGSFPPFDVDKADNEKYGVKGSPTLVVNGVEAASAGRDAKSLLKTICSGFSTEPKECATELSSAAPAPGFGEGTAAVQGTADAACGS